MPKRSIAAGLALALFLSGWCYVSDHVVRAGELVSNLMPVAVYGALVAAMLMLVAVQGLTKGRHGYSPAAIAGVVAIFLFACGIPGRFTQCLPSSIMIPLHEERLRPGWQDEHVLDLVPRRMLPDVSNDEDRALNGFVTGLAEGDEHISLRDVPWDAWRRPLLFWLPLMLSLTLATLGLAAVVHRQWAHHEQLPYPIATFAHAVISDDDHNGGSLFRNRLFLASFVAVLAIELNNYACRWWPEVLIPVTLRFNFSAFARHLPFIVQGKGMGLLYPQVILPVLGLAYFLASDVSLSMAAGPWIYCLFAGILMAYGVELRPGREMALSIETFLYSGGYFGILLVTVYTGRRFYWSALKRGLGRPGVEAVPTYAVRGMQLFLACSLVSLGLLFWVRVPLVPAVLYLLFALMVFVVVSRIVAETGAFIIGTFVFPGVLLWGFFGAEALGPQAMVTLFMLSTVLLLIPARAPMAFMVHALRLSDLARNKVGHATTWGTAVVIVSMAVAVPVSIYWQYNLGTPNYGWPRTAATYPFENTVEAIHTLKAQGRHEDATSAQGLDRLLSVSPSWPHVTAFMAAAALAIGFAAGRLKFRHWPLHPVIFLFLGGHAAISMSFSFFLGWLIKAAASKYGGAGLYRRLRPCMFGIIAGAVLGQFVPIIVGSLYFAATGHASR